MANSCDEKSGLIYTNELLFVFFAPIWMILPTSPTESLEDLCKVALQSLCFGIHTTATPNHTQLRQD
jgi:hypothetical protein